MISAYCLWLNTIGWQAVVGQRYHLHSHPRRLLVLSGSHGLVARSIVGWSMSERMTDTLVQDALMAAYWRRKPEGTVRLHSDQGSQYSSRDFRTLLSSLNMEASMSRRGNCWDNAVAESFFGNLKKEKIRRHKYKTREEAKRAIFHYMRTPIFKP